jgi:hypothetical protein
MVIEGAPINRPEPGRERRMRSPRSVGTDEVCGSPDRPEKRPLHLDGFWLQTRLQIVLQEREVVETRFGLLAIMEAIRLSN